MNKWYWRQDYVFDRVDLYEKMPHEKLKYRSVLRGWICRARTDAIETVSIARNTSGYAILFKAIQDPNAKYEWTIWWPIYEDHRFNKNESDNAKYETMKEAMIALRAKLGAGTDPIETDLWPGGNLYSMPY